MSSDNLDLVVLGGGTGGYVAAVRAAQLGMRVAVVERGKLGGTCLHRGCIPTKALLRSAEVYSVAKRADEFGVIHNQPTFNLQQAMHRKARVVDQLHKGVQFLMKKHAIAVYQGVGRVMGPSIFSPQAGVVAVETEDGDRVLLNGRYTLIATGSRPKALPGLPFDGKHVLSSDDAVELEALPASVIIVGGGAIGVEWASLLSDLDITVTILEAADRLLCTEDAEISAEIARTLKKRKVSIVTGASVLTDTFAVTETGTAISATVGGEERRFNADVILVSVGREAVTDDIGLEATEIITNKGFIQVDGNYRTKESTIFAIGDVIGGLQLAHVAAHEGIHAVETMAGEVLRPLNYDMVPRCVYSRPEIASVGLTEAEALQRGHGVKTGKFQFRAIGKALIHGDTDGFVKVVADSVTNDVLGVHMIGPHVTDYISEAGLALVLNATPWEIGRTIHPHPTLSEALGEAALAVDGMAIHGA